ncbi:MAG: hypothetical protein H7255_01440 [Ramlibacter sp.]|nr:hypothetical protein [Ramlibacter sp.]
MPHNPYTPPEAPLKEQPRPPGSPVKAVLIGLAIDIGGSLVLGIVLSVLYAISLSSGGMNAQEVGEAMANIPTNSWPYIAGILGGAILSFMGGYGCARIARRSEYRLAFILASLSAGFGLVTSWDTYDVTQNLLLALTTVACVVLGAKYGRAANAS